MRTNRSADHAGRHELLEHRWHLSQQAGRDVGMAAAVADYVAAILPDRPDEELLIPADSGGVGLVELDSLAAGSDQGGAAD